MSREIRVIGVAGGSGSGKTTIARALAGRLGLDRCLILAQDRYYHDQSARFDGDGGSVNFDDPASIDFALLASHVTELRAGREARVPIYDFASHTRRPETDLLEPRPVVIVDGTLILGQPAVRACLDAAVFVRCPEALRYARRLARDTRERGREPDGVRRQFERQVKPMHDQHVEPSAAHAGLVIVGEGDLGRAVESVLAALGIAGHPGAKE